MKRKIQLEIDADETHCRTCVNCDIDEVAWCKLFRIRLYVEEESRNGLNPKRCQSCLDAEKEASHDR